MSARISRAAQSGWGAAALLMLLQVGLALPYLHTVPRFYNDEAWEASLGASLAQEGTLRHGFVEGWGGMHVHFVQTQAVLPLVCAPIFRAAGVSVLTSRLGSVIVSAAAVGCLYGVMRRWFGARTAWWIGLATVAHPWFFEISRRVRPEIYFLALGLAALWCLVHAGESRSRLSALAAGALAGLATVAHPTGFILVFSVAVGVLLWMGKGWGIRRLLWVGAGFVAGVLPYVAFVLWSVQDPQVDLLVQLRGTKSVIGASPVSLVQGELKRWAHFFQWPKGAPLGVIAAGSWLAAWYRSTRADKALATGVAVFAIILPFINVNITSRYLTALTPLLAALIVRLIARLMAGPEGASPGRRTCGVAMGLGVAVVYTAMCVGALGLMFHRLRGADVSRVVGKVAAVVGPESRVYGPPILWMGEGRYRFGPYPMAQHVTGTVEMVAAHRFDYAVRSAWDLWSSHGVSPPPAEMPPIRAETIDQVCDRYGTKVAEFRDPDYGPFEIYRLEWAAPAEER